MALVKVLLLGGKGGGGRERFCQAGGSNKASIDKVFKLLMKKLIKFFLRLEFIASKNLFVVKNFDLANQNCQILS